jgi:hypothetical protein
LHWNWNPRRGKGAVFPASKIIIEKPGNYPVALRSGSDTIWGGLQLFNVKMKCIR